MSEGKIAFVFSGQGAQCPGMGKALCETSKAAAAVFALADRIRPGTSQQCFHGTKEELNLTINTQPCLFSVDLAAARAVEELGIRADLTAGFSLGEIAALAFSGALEDESAFRLVCKRAEFMQEAAERNPGAMGAALGIDAEKLSKVLARFENAQAVNFNCPGQIVFAAKESDIDEIAAAVQENGGKFRRLAVSGAFHSRFMEDASRKMLEYLKNVSVRPASVPVYANRTAEPLCSDAMAVVCAPDFDCPDRLTVAALAAQPLLLREKGSGGRSCVDAVLETHDCKARPRAEGATNLGLLRLAEGGFGVFVAYALGAQFAAHGVYAHGAAGVYLYGALGVAAVVDKAVFGQAVERRFHGRRHVASRQQ